MPNWVSDGGSLKYNRAVKALKDLKADVTEDAVKELYIKYGGLVNESPIVEEMVEEEVAPRKRGK